MGTNASGNQSGDSAQTWDVVNSGQSEDIENSLTGQGTSDRETLMDIVKANGDSPIPPEKLRFNIYVPIGNDPEGRLVLEDAKAATLVRLPEGTYRVVSTYGDSNAIMSADLRVEVGQVTRTDVAQAEAQPNGGFRQAASALPRIVLDAMDACIAGTPLDAAAEQQALRKHWQR